MKKPSTGIWLTANEFYAFSSRKAPPNLRDSIATRARAGESYGLDWDLPNPDIILRKTGNDITVYDNLLIDSHVGADVISRKGGVKSLDWSVDRESSPARVHEAVDDMIRALPVDVIIGEILNAPLYGFQPLEVTWSTDGRFVVPAAVEGKPQRWFTFDQRNQLRFKSIHQANGEELPPMKFLLARHDATYDNPYGFPLLSRCFWPVAFKKGGFKFWVQFTEKYGGAFAIGKHPRGLGEGEVAALADMLEAMIQSAVAVIPDDSQVEIKEAGGKGESADIYERLIKISNAEISKALLGQTLTTEAGDRGSFSLGKVHGDIRTEIIDGDKRLMCTVF